MTIDTTIPPAPTRPARPTRSRKAPARWGRRRRLTIPRRRATGRFQLPDASMALNTLMLEGDIYKIGREHYLVVPLRDDMLEMLIVAAAGTEDDEANGDMEPSLGTEDDLELGIDDEPHDEPYQDMEPSLAGIHAGMQEGISMSDKEGPDDDAEPDFDNEADHEGEGGDNGADPSGSDMPLGPADIDAQRGRIASKWPTFSRGGRA
jgi:hypothetical protein